MSIRRRNSLIIFTAILVSAAPALALFDIQDPLTKRYNTESRVVIAGAITSINAENHVLTVKPTTVYKGTPPAEGESLQIQMYAPESLRNEAKEGQPVVVFKGVKSAAIHVADHWYLAESLAKANQFRITARLSPAYDETFPGTTAELIKALDEIKAGKSTLIDAFPKIDFPAAKKIATLPPHAVAFAATEDSNSPIFFVATKGKFQAFVLQQDKTLKDKTAALGLEKIQPIPNLLAAYSEGPLLLIDHNFYLPSGLDGKLRQWPDYRTLGDEKPGEKILAAAFSEELVVLTPHAIKRVPKSAMFPTDEELARRVSPQAEPHAPDAPPPPPFPPLKGPWSDDGARLTGAKLTDYLKLPGNVFTAASIAVVDINHDDRPDLILATPQGVLTLLNRGFGCYLVNKDFAAPLLDPGKTGKPAMPLLASTPNSAAGKREVRTLWALEDDGTLYCYDFK